MTISDLAPITEYFEDGVTLSFPVPFRFLDPLDIQAARNDSGLVTFLVNNSDYFVTGGDTDAGGTLTLVDTIAGATLRLLRATPRAQTTDYQTDDSFPAETHEAALDKLMAIAQETDAGMMECASRALMVPVGETVDLVPALSLRANMFLGFDALGNPIVLSGTAGGDMALRTDLGGASGAAMIGWIQSGAIAVMRSVQGKLREAMQTVQDRGAVPGGTLDARPAFAACDALGAFVVPPGLYLIAGNITIASLVEFAPGARLVIGNGVKVTFNGGIRAGQYQIFNITGTGAVAGLHDAWFEWFANDIKTIGATPPSVDCRPAFNQFAAALDRGAVPDYPSGGCAIGRIGVGSWAYDGTTATLLRNVSLVGISSGATNFYCMTPAVNFAILRFNRGQVSGFQLLMLAPGMMPTSGTALVNQARNGTFKDAIVDSCYIGWDVTSEASSNTYTGCPVFNARYQGRKVNAQEQHFHDSHVVGTEDWATITTTTGSFNFGDAVSIAGASGTITQTFGGGRFKIVWFGKRPVAPLPITDTTTGGTGTLTVNEPSHQGGGLYWYTLAGNAQCGNVTDDGDIIGGDWGLIVQGGGAVNACLGNPAWCRTDVTFCSDTTYYGNKVDRAYGCDFHGWFSSAQSPDAIGFKLTNSRRTRLNGTQHVNNAGQGIWADNTNYQTAIINPVMDGNCYSHTTTTAMAEIALVGTVVHDVQVIGGTMGYDDLFGRTPNLGLYIGKVDGTAGGQVSRVILSGMDCADGKAVINATQVNTTNQRLRISACQSLTDQ